MSRDVELAGFSIQQVRARTIAEFVVMSMRLSTIWKINDSFLVICKCHLISRREGMSRIILGLCLWICQVSESQVPFFFFPSFRYRPTILAHFKNNTDLAASLSVLFLRMYTRGFNDELRKTIVIVQG